MRVVFVNRIAWPDEGATAIYLTDVAEACAAAGHDVHVVCGEAAYRRAAAGRAAPIRHAGVRYHRIPGRRGRGILDRALASLEFTARAGWRLLRVPRADVVVALTDPPFVDVVASAVGRLRGARAVHWLMDVYPDVAVAAGVLSPRGIADRALGAVMAWTLRRAGAVVVLGRAMRRPVLARGVPRRHVRVIENWAPREVEAAARLAAPPRPDRPLTLMYSGNYGRAHDLAPLVDALRALPPGTNLRVILQVGGARAPELLAQVRDLPIPVEVRPPAPSARLADALREGDVHVVSVRPGFERLLVPSKMYAPLRLGLPLLVIGPRTSEPARQVLRHGIGFRLEDGGIPTRPFPSAARWATFSGPSAWVAVIAARDMSSPGGSRLD